MKPTIGRKVWFRLNGATYIDASSRRPQELFSGQAMDATIVCVLGDSTVNLSVTDHGGTAHSIRSVELVSPGQQKPEFSMYCEWPPHQVDQAKKQSEPVLFPMERATADALVRIVQKIDEQITAEA